MIPVATMIVLALYLVRCRLFHGAAAVGSLALCIAALMAMLDAQYAVALWHRPFADSWLVAADRALGFDWAAYRRFCADSPIILAALTSGYRASFYVLFIAIAIGALRDPARSVRAAILFALCGAVTIAIFGLCPALGPAYAEGAGGEWAEFARDVSLPAFAGVHTPGVVGLVFFPSFHTVAAALIVYTVRGWPKWAQAVPYAVAGLTFLAVCPVGGHYLTDEIAGALLVVVAAKGLNVARHVPAKALEVTG